MKNFLYLLYLTCMIHYNPLEVLPKILMQIARVH